MPVTPTWHPCLKPAPVADDSGTGHGRFLKTGGQLSDQRQIFLFFNAVAGGNNDPGLGEIGILCHGRCNPI